MLAKLVLTHVPDKTSSSIVEKRIGANFAVHAKTIEVTHSITVLLCGRLQNPVLTCQKAISDPIRDNISVIPLVAKVNQDVQKFKLPFIAVNDLTPETEFEFIFIKSVQPEPTESGDSFEERQFRVFDCMTFFCLPAVLKVGPDSPAILSVQLQINQDKIRQLPRELLQMQMTKLLVARIKNTKLIQSFYLTMCLTE